MTASSGTAKSLAYAPSGDTLYVLHTVGSNHVRLSVDDNGAFAAGRGALLRGAARQARSCATMILLAPDGQFLLVGCSVTAPAVILSGALSKVSARETKPHQRDRTGARDHSSSKSRGV